MFNVRTFELGLGGLVDLVKIFFLLQVVISESPGWLEDTFDIDFLVQFGLYKDMIVNALKFFLDPGDFFAVTGIELFIGLEQGEPGSVFVNNNGLRVT